MRFFEGPCAIRSQCRRPPVSWKRLAREPSEAFYGGGRRIRTSEVVRRQIYSLFPLATRESLQGRSVSASPKIHLLPCIWSFLLCRSIHCLWSWRWDSNPQPADYKSAALPIELRQRKISFIHKSCRQVKSFSQKTEVIVIDHFNRGVNIFLF